MLTSMKNAMHTIGDNTGEIARRVGSGTAHVATRVARGTADVARRIGPRRAIIGAAIVGAAIGGTLLLMRYLRARKSELPTEAGETEHEDDGHPRGKRASREARRAAKRQEARVTH